MSTSEDGGGLVVCPRCPTFGEWHHEHALEVAPVPVFDRAALVRAVLGQQWLTAMARFSHSQTLTINPIDDPVPITLTTEPDAKVGLFDEPKIYDSRSADDVVADILGER